MSSKKPSSSTKARIKAHATTLERLGKMSPDELFQTMVDAGIYTAEGKVRPPYAKASPAPAKRAKRHAA